MRLRQTAVLAVFGVFCIFLYLYVPHNFSKQDDVSIDVMQRVNQIISNSATLTSPTQKAIDVKSTKSDVIIEDENNLLSIAKRISAYNRTVLVTMVNDAYLSFTYSWLCNTKNMGIHRSVLIITTDEISKKRLTKDWPEVSVVSMDIGSKGDQTYSQVGYVKIMVTRTEMILSILMADIEVFLIEVDCLWLANPVPELQRTTGYDILVNPVANTNMVFAGGFLWLYTTNKAKALWKKLTEQMVTLGKRISHQSDNTAVSEADNDQQYFSRLVNQRYMNVSIKILPLDVYADGKWYQLPEDKRNKSRPVIINNNWVLGNKAKIDRAKKWKHWFIHEDFTCDMDLVNKTVY